MNRTHASLAGTFVAALLVAACGSDPAATSSTPTPPGGTSTTAAAIKGVVTAVGPLTVNGIRFDTAGAAIRIDDSPGRPESELKAGMVVRVKGSKDDAAGSGRATEIEAHHVVSGKVDDKGGGILRVGGHEVEIEQNTRFEDDTARLGSIDVGERVRVHGHPTSMGRIRASRVEKEPGTSESFDVKGFVSDLDRTGGTFTLKVSPDAASSYVVTLASGATIPSGVANGSYVEVRSATPPAGGAITATAVVLEDARLGQAQDEVEVEGLVTSGTSASFVVDGQPVATSASTRWDNGVPGDLLPGTKVEAEGRLDGAGVLQATKVSFRAIVLLQGAVSAVSATSPHEGTFLVLGLTVRTDFLTEWKSSGGGSSLDLASIGTGPVEVRGMPGASGEIVATRVTATTDDRLLLQGPVSAKDAAAGTLLILGITVQTGSGTEFSGISGPSSSPAAFFSEVVAGRTVVKARSRTPFAGSTFSAEKAEVEGSR